jgi:2-polyprenyl-6-methoxyphenol hydroxylase-like FAD-dependent oxidoreductase
VVELQAIAQSESSVPKEFGGRNIVMAVQPRIAIVGGGPAGLTCARILQLHGLQATIYEYEKSAESRAQGGSLDLHADSGMLAMIASGLVEEFNAKARPEGSQVRILDKNGQVWLDIKPDGKEEGADQRPEIDRAQLREIFLASLSEGTVQWDRKLVSVERIGDGRHTLVFEDGAREEADLVIGADGAWSKVRPLVSDKSPAYTGVTFVDAVIKNVDDRFPELGELCGLGLCVMLSPAGGLVAQRNSGGKICVYVVAKVEEGWARTEFAEAAVGGPESARRLLLSLFEGWSPALLELVHICDDDPLFWARPIFALPVDHAWRPKRGVTVVGDAAHVMSPFAGEGVNIAMLDALELAVALAEAWKANPSVESLYDAIPAFEQTMFARAKQSCTFSANNQALAFDERGPHDFVEAMAAMVSGGGPPQ